MAVVAWTIGCGVVLAIVWILLRIQYAILTLPLRRRERARMFLSVVESAVRRGQSPEYALVNMARLSRPSAVQVLLGTGEVSSGFRSLAWRLEAGVGLIDALRQIRGFLPARITETLAVGQALGDISRVLPACRQVLEDTAPKMRSALNYFVVLGPGLLLLLGLGTVGGIITGYLVPQYVRMFREVGPQTFGESSLLVQVAPVLVTTAWVIMFILLGCLLFYIGGPFLKESAALRGLADSVSVWLPWSRKRLQRSFVGMLALLLDAGVPESEAVRLAGQSTGNLVFSGRARRVIQALEGGVPLTEAIGRMHSGREFRWRLETAAQAGGGARGFAQALEGWRDALSAKAEQQEQTAGHLLTTAVVLANGAIVAFFAITLFGMLIELIERMEAALW